MKEEIEGIAPPEMSGKIAKNSFAGVLRFLVVTAVLFLIVPYTLHKLGNERYGIWALVGVLTTYAQLSDFGIGTSLVKFVAEFWARRDVDRISEVVTTALVLYGLLGAVAGLVMILLRESLVAGVFHVPAELYDEAMFVVTGTIIIFISNLILSAFSSILMGLQRMEITNSVVVVATIVNALGVYVVLENGFGLRGLIINNGVVSLVAAIANFWMAKKLLPALKS